MSLSDEDSDGKTELLLAAAGMVNEHFLMPPRRGGSSKKREGNIDRDREAGYVRLYKEYFHPIRPIYKAKEFCRRYRMSRELFLIILNGVRDYDDYFEVKYDCTAASSLTKNVLRPFGRLHLDCHVILLTITYA
jgi:hypothetical protein